MMNNKRREFFKTLGITGLSFAGSGSISVYGYNKFSKQPINQNSQFVPYNRFPRMVQEYFVDLVRQKEQEIIERQSLLLTKSDAEAYVREVKYKLQLCFGPWPDKTPLNAKITGVIERDSYNIENVIFESRPEYQVTANLYIPKGLNFPLPGVVGTCGHDPKGKGGITYQSYAQGLAKKGYVVLIFDPIGQGERVQYLNDELKSRLGASGVQEHYHIGDQMVITGEKLNSWFAWDGMRALDYLLTRKEVDPKHIGVTGNSGGGTQTAWLCAVEPRFSMAAPSCFFSTYRRTIENEHDADPEQCPPQVLGMGLDYSDFIAAMAPKPVILLGQKKDFFDARGLNETFVRLKHLYKLLGAEENVELFIGPDYHGYSQANREAMYGWFNKAVKIPGTSVEPPINLEKNETLFCSPKGQVTVNGSRSAFSFINDLSVSLTKRRKNLSGDELKNAIHKRLQLSPSIEPPDYRILVRYARENRSYPKKFAGHYAVETEPGIFALVYRLSDELLYAQIPSGYKKAILYISHQSADEELRSEQLIADLIRSEPNSATFACDVRGVGDSKPQKDDFFYAAFSNMLGISSFVGQKTHDVLRVIHLLKSYGHEDIHLVAKGYGAIPATFAALLSDAVTRITLKNALTSYRDIAEHEEYDWPVSSFLPGVLKAFDLPECYSELASKNIKLIEPWGAEIIGKG